MYKYMQIYLFSAFRLYKQFRCQEKLDKRKAKWYYRSILKKNIKITTRDCKFVSITNREDQRTLKLSKHAFYRSLVRMLCKRHGEIYVLLYNIRNLWQKFNHPASFCLPVDFREIDSSDFERPLRYTYSDTPHAM